MKPISVSLCVICYRCFFYWYSLCFCHTGTSMWAAVSSYASNIFLDYTSASLFISPVIEVIVNNVMLRLACNCSLVTVCLLLQISFSATLLPCIVQPAWQSVTDKGCNWAACFLESLFDCRKNKGKKWQLNIKIMCLFSVFANYQVCQITQRDRHISAFSALSFFSFISLLILRFSSLFCLLLIFVVTTCGKLLISSKQTTLKRAFDAATAFVGLWCQCFWL